MHRRLAADESGAILPLVIGYAAIAMALIVFATAAMSLHTTQKRLDGVADASALAAAQGYVLTATPTGATAVLREDEVRRQAARVVSFATDVTLVRASTEDAITARVEVRTVWHPPILSPLVPEGFELTSIATSRTALDAD